MTSQFTRDRETICALIILRKSLHWIYFLQLKIQPLFEKAESKNKLLRSVAGEGIDQIGQLQSRWDKFELMMESHELMVKEQVGLVCF